MVTSDFRPEVEIRPFRACAMKNTQYNAYLWPNRRNSRVLQEIGVEEHDGNIRLQTGSGNIALSFMRHASGHNSRNSSFYINPHYITLIADVAMGQIPRSTERISSFGTKIVTFTYLFCLFCSSCLFSHHIVLSPLHALPTIAMCIVKNAVTPV